MDHCVIPPCSRASVGTYDGTTAEPPAAGTSRVRYQKYYK